MFFFTGIIVFILAIVVTYLLEKLPMMAHFVDIPGPRKMHSQPIPRNGGLVFFLIPAAAALIFSWHIPLYFWLSTLVIYLGGLKDDFTPSNTVRAKLFYQILGCLIFAIGIPSEDLLYLGSGQIVLCRTLAFAMTLFMTNAMNLMDNMNGLSSGLAILLLTTLSFLGASTDLNWLVLPLGIVALCTSAFFLRNFFQGRIFMGDQGSQLLGFMSAASCFLILLNKFTIQPPESVGFTFLKAALLALLFFFPFIYDTVSVIIIRTRAKRSILQGDTEHLSHRLKTLGLNTTCVVLLIHLFQIVYCAIFIWIFLRAL